MCLLEFGGLGVSPGSTGVPAPQADECSQLPEAQFSVTNSGLRPGPPHPVKPPAPRAHYTRWREG